jgi:UDP-glucose 4-epimerase
MKTVVAGATGFLGSNLVSKLLERGDDVVAFSRKGVRAEALRAAGVEVVEGDLYDHRTILRLRLEGVDALVHHASTTSPGASVAGSGTDEADIASSAILFRHAVEAGVKKIIFSSSGGTVYGDPEVIPVNENHPVDPLIPYARTKLAIESELRLACEGSDTNQVTFRYGNPYGPNQYPLRGTGVITAWLEAARDNRPIHVFGHLTDARDFVFISDAADAAIAALDSSEARGTYNIGTGKATALADVLEAIEKVIDRRLEVVESPPRASDKVSRIALDSTRAQEHFGWTPVTTLEEGISRTWDWVRDGEHFRVG